jgi:hypothetical protein
MTCRISILCERSKAHCIIARNSRLLLQCHSFARALLHGQSTAATLGAVHGNSRGFGWCWHGCLAMSGALLRPPISESLVPTWSTFSGNSEQPYSTPSCLLCGPILASQSFAVWSLPQTCPNPGQHECGLISFKPPLVHPLKQLPL